MSKIQRFFSFINSRSVRALLYKEWLTHKEMIITWVALWFVALFVLQAFSINSFLIVFCAIYAAVVAPKIAGKDIEEGSASYTMTLPHARDDIFIVRLFIGLAPLFLMLALAIFASRECIPEKVWGLVVESGFHEEFSLSKRGGFYTGNSMNGSIDYIKDGSTITYAGYFGEYNEFTFNRAEFFIKPKIILAIGISFAVFALAFCLATFAKTRDGVRNAGPYSFCLIYISNEITVVAYSEMYRKIYPDLIGVVLVIIGLVCLVIANLAYRKKGEPKGNSLLGTDINKREWGIIVIVIICILYFAGYIEHFENREVKIPTLDGPQKITVEEMMSIKK